MTTISANRKEVFRIVVAEEDSVFVELLSNIIDHIQTLFPALVFAIQKISDINEIYDSQRMELIFLEDRFLLNTTGLSQRRVAEEVEMILLLNNQFFSENSRKIKQAINENSLNLTEHISLTNHPISLIKLLIIDSIKAKLNVQ
jgi:hypothetical protein